MRMGTWHQACQFRRSTKTKADLELTV
jgi:hypothetical protein